MNGRNDGKAIRVKHRSPRDHGMKEQVKESGKSSLYATINKSYLQDKGRIAGELYHQEPEVCIRAAKHYPDMMENPRREISKDQNAARNQRSNQLPRKDTWNKQRNPTHANSEEKPVPVHSKITVMKPNSATACGYPSSCRSEPP